MCVPQKLAPSRVYLQRGGCSTTDGDIAVNAPEPLTPVHGLRYDGAGSECSPFRLTLAPGPA